MEKNKSKKPELIKKTDLQTMRDNYQQAALRKEKLYVLLDMLETQQLSPEEHERVYEQAEKHIQVQGYTEWIKKQQATGSSKEFPV